MLASKKHPLIISGPSGSGKSTLLKKLFSEYPSIFRFSVSDTTRSPRPKEINGKDYHFLTEEQFKLKIEMQKFVEHATFSGNMYGTSIDALEGQGVCVLDIERQGVENLKKMKHLHAYYVRIVPPSIEELALRLKQRGTETEENLSRRLEIASIDERWANTEVGQSIFDKVIINDDVDRAYSEFRDWVRQIYHLQ
jgi:guanylate kinase